MTPGPQSVSVCTAVLRGTFHMCIGVLPFAGADVSHCKAPKNEGEAAQGPKPEEGPDQHQKIMNPPPRPRRPLNEEHYDAAHFRSFICSPNVEHFEPRVRKASLCDSLHHGHKR